MANNPATDAPTRSESLRVLLVCTGNICRSPLAEQVLRSLAEKSELAEALEFASAGVMAQVGSAVHPKTVESMKKISMDAGPHAAGQISRDMIIDSGLILVATTEHRSEMARTAMRAVPQAFTMKEFVRVGEYLSSGSTAERPELNQKYLTATSPTERVKLASQFRGYAPPATATEDIVDPWGQSEEVFDEVAQEISALAARVMKYLHGGTKSGEIN